MERAGATVGAGQSSQVGQPGRQDLPPPGDPADHGPSADPGPTMRSSSPARHAARHTTIAPSHRPRDLAAPLRPAGDGASAAPIGAASVWRGVRWTGQTVGVAAASYFMAFIALWAGSWVDHASLAGTAVRWDGSWYYRISQLGYVSAIPKTPTQYAALRPAFFPGLPLLERAVHDVVGGAPAATTLLIGAAGLVVSCLLLRALVSLEFGDDVAWRATVLFAFFPGAYVFVMGYSEALAIPLAVLALYALRRRWYLVAGVATAAATGTRLLDVALVLACVVAAVREVLVARGSERVRWFTLSSAIASPVLGLGGLAAFAVYLHHKTGSYVAFQTAERIGWSNAVNFAEPYRAFQEFAANPFATPFVTVNAIGMIVLAGCLVFLVAAGVHRLRLEELVYAAVILLAWMFTSNTGAWFRFIESAFPVLVLLALRLGRRWYPAVACAGAFLLGILIVLFATAVSFSP